MTFIDEMETLAIRLRSTGNVVSTPIREENTLDWNSLPEADALALKKNYIDHHLANIRKADLVLLASYEKKGIDGYIGANSLMEAAFAYALGIQVAYLNSIGDQPCRLEALAISQLILGDNLEVLTSAAMRKASKQHI